MSETDWQTMESAPKDGTVVDLWITGPDGDVDFYAPLATKVKGKPIRHGRVTNVRWEKRGLNEAAWYPVGGLGYPVTFSGVTATHWRHPPKGPIQ